MNAVVDEIVMAEDGRLWLTGRARCELDVARRVRGDFVLAVADGSDFGGGGQVEQIVEGVCAAGRVERMRR